MVQDYLGDKLNSLTFKPSLIHRIDKDTSGIVLIAKTKPALDFMLSALQNNRIEKKYIAVCSGILTKKRDTIKAKLERLENAKNENKVQVSEAGQSAITHYRVLHEDKENNWSVVECHIETGRMHQIRVHMAHIGHSVI
jgi:23S rRNA-/tRNA-specific pseudouridylate synthase